jgi:hypothetical protein
MLAIERSPKKAENKKREFVGRAWINPTKKDCPPELLKTVQDAFQSGNFMVQVRLDDDIKALNLGQEDSFQLWSNSKRPGKIDADLRASVVSVGATQ